MRTQIFTWIALMGLSLMGSCAHNAESGKDNKMKTDEHAGQPQPQVWFKGSVEDAFKAAQKDKKMVFLYWGAIWCPPCNELKTQVFTKPRFAELMTSFIPVYLDGDTDAAQVWGAKFQAAGYPTVLILDDKKKELFRLSTVMSIEEFDSVVQSVLASSGSLERAAMAVGESRAKRQDLQLLAYSSWDELPEEKWPISRRINLMEQAFESSENAKEKSIFASTWISQVIGAKEKIADKQLDRLWAAIFADSDTVWASREFVKYQAGAVVGWLGWKPTEKRYLYLRSQWLKAAAQLEAEPNASVNTRLATVTPEVELYRYEHPDEKVSQALRTKVEIAVRHADEDAKTEYDRHAVISEAAHMLNQVESYDLAVKLLAKELKATNTPWYYQRSMAYLEKMRGNNEAAKKWSAEARKSVQGRASRVEWIANDLLLNAEDGQNRPYLLDLTREFYGQAMQLQDGFAGRNWTRAKTVQGALEPYKTDPLFQKTFAEFAARCDRQSGDSKKNCLEHFAALK